MDINILHNVNLLTLNYFFNSIILWVPSMQFLSLLLINKDVSINVSINTTFVMFKWAEYTTCYKDII